VTAQGTALTRYRRVIEAGSVRMAELAAREMGWVPLREALALVVLYAVEGDPRFERAAARWLGQLTVERRELEVQEIQLAVAALQAMPARLGVSPLPPRARNSCPTSADDAQAVRSHSSPGGSDRGGLMRLPAGCSPSPIT